MTVEIDLIPEYVIEALEGRGLTTHDIENATPEEIEKARIRQQQVKKKRATASNNLTTLNKRNKNDF